VTGLIRDALLEIPKRVKDIELLLSENRIWRQRTVGIGAIAAAQALEYGLTGPALRASGVRRDLRRDIPYCSYEDFEFDIPLGTRGDIYDRYQVRIDEIHQSLGIIAQALDRLPPGEVRARLPKILKIPPAETFQTIESPKGELGFYMKSNGTEKPERVKMKAPSFINLQSLELMCKGNLFSDVVGILGSLDVVLGEVDK
jgi:NADH-quinone oxidoreductase subunit D